MTKIKAKPPKTPARAVPAETDEPTVPKVRPHPMSLNPNEGRWFNLCRGPIDGWFSFGLHGNPPFGIPVQVVIRSKIINSEVVRVGTGIRTREVEYFRKELWNTVSGVPGDVLSGDLIYWRPLSPMPWASEMPEAPDL
jgi:hypothetical protein